MAVAVVSGSSGLIGSETVKFLHEQGFDVVGLDNDMRRYFFGDEASTQWQREKLEQLPRFKHHSTDIRDQAAVNDIFKHHGPAIDIVVQESGVEYEIAIGYLYGEAKIVIGGFDQLVLGGGIRVPVGGNRN